MIINNCNNNKCSRCGQCCTDFAFISDGEINAIKTYLKAHPEIKEEWAKPIDGKVAVLCPFYNPRDRKCNIYKVRPKVCRIFKCNKSELVVSQDKKQFTADKYYNVEDLHSWHAIFFGNLLQQNAVERDIRIVLGEEKG